MFIQIYMIIFVQKIFINEQQIAPTNSKKKRIERFQHEIRRNRREVEPFECGI